MGYAEMVGGRTTMKGRKEGWKGEYRREGVRGRCEIIQMV